MRITNVRFVNESRWDSWTAEATLLGVLGVLAALGVLWYVLYE
jgi:hypothetical protein